MLRAYEGKEPYAFVSYAHKDNVAVFHIIKQLMDRGYRIWYDEGIAPGSEWPENIAQHLNGAAMVLAFITDNSMNSANCRREITFALAKHKPFLSIILEKTDIPLGMELQLSAQQSVMRYNYDDEERFLEKICSCPALAPCLGAPKKVVKPAAAPAESAAPQPKAQVPTDMQSLVKTCEDAGITFSKRPSNNPNPFAAKAEKAAKPAKEKAVKPAAPAKETAPKPATGEGKELPKKPLIFAAVGVAVVLLLSLMFCGGGSGSGNGGGLLNKEVEILPGYTVQSDASYVNISEATLTADVVTKLNGLADLTAIYLEDCEVETEVFSQLTELSRLYTISIKNCTGLSSIADFSFLADATELITLELINCGLTDVNFPDLSGLDLSELNISGNKDFTDLSLVKGSPEEIDFSNTGVTDVTPLASIADLTTVIGHDNAITDIIALAPLTELIYMDFSNCQITAVMEPFLSLHMASLYMSGNPIESSEGFENFTVLRHLDLSYTELYDYDIRWISKNVATLATLNLSGLYMDNFEFLNSCHSLSRLYVNDMGYTLDLKPVANCSALVELQAVNSRVSDVTPLSGLTKLETLRLAVNRITDISGLPTLAGTSPVLDLAGNQITSLAGLPKGNYRVLSLFENPLELTASDFEGIEGFVLAMDYHENIPTSHLKNNPFTNFRMLNCPLDKQVALESAYVTFDTFDSIIEALNGYNLSYDRWVAEE